MKNKLQKVCDDIRKLCLERTKSNINNESFQLGYRSAGQHAIWKIEELIRREEMNEKVSKSLSS